ncbi:carbohydrate kinase family protein [Aquisalimonas asiatica]|uniref:Fructokinase n=1 Tax=Aquisalimonas asiatica TaxID=406100 RepID=A0A1H8RJM1_9GAMM|nr:carbohydrate kinase [Aquisalimonas asiatica]SEO66522.1 fructokinase [Aquisalimonas asiatica]
MTPVIAFGEALVDMLSSRLGDGADSETETFTPYAGGAPANVAVACARLGVPSRFLGMVGADYFGDFLVQELTRHGVDTSGIARTGEARTALAFVSRDASGERTFDFYRPPAADLLYRPHHLPGGVFDVRAILHCCSNSLTEPAIAETTFAIVGQASAAGCLISVDVNLRHDLWPGGQADARRVTRLLDRAALVKLGREELDALRGEQPVDTWFRDRFDAGVRLVIVTDGPGTVDVRTAELGFVQRPPPVQAVDTTAGGDAFTGGLLAMLARDGIDAPWHRDAGRLRAMVDVACRCGAHAVTRPGAYTALPTTADVRF